MQDINLGLKNSLHINHITPLPSKTCDTELQLHWSLPSGPCCWSIRASDPVVDQIIMGKENNACTVYKHLLAEAAGGRRQHDTHPIYLDCFFKIWIKSACLSYCAWLGVPTACRSGLLLCFNNNNNNNYLLINMWRAEFFLNK